MSKRIFLWNVASDLKQEKGSLLDNMVTLSRLWTLAGSRGSTYDK